ncbi:MAG: T9SS type A sorting domain-containing protein, partial [Bacteroidota bacterium]
KSLQLINQTGNSSGSRDAILSPVLNFDGVSGVTMNFDVAFARKNNSDASSLKVSATNNCGQGWMMRYNKSGAGLETAPLSTSLFVPTALQWRNETVNLLSNAISGKPAIRLKFEFTNDQGNNIYIDNINITGNTNTIDVLDGVSEFNLFPNPSQGDFHVYFKLEKKLSILYSVKDITGREIISERKEFEAGNQEVIIASKLVPGIYIFTLATTNSQYAQKLIVR